MNFRQLVAFIALLLLPVCAFADDIVVIRLGTILPAGTSQYTTLVELGERWRELSHGTVKLVLYPDGRLGGEAEMIKKLRIKQLNAGLFSAVGLAEIDLSARGLQVMPLMFRSWAEVDYVREKIRPQLEAQLRAKGFQVLFWADAGWVRFFSKTAAVAPDDFRRLKMFAWAGDTAQLEIMRSMRCQPVPLETTDILLGLNTGMIETVAVPPLVALAGQVNRPAPHMLELDWAPIVGATIVRTDVWEKIPADLRPALQAACDVMGEKIRLRGRQENDEAIRAMQAHGLQLHPLPPALRAEWEQLAASLHLQLRGRIVPADIFDAVERNLREFRANQNVAVVQP